MMKFWKTKLRSTLSLFLFSKSFHVLLSSEPQKPKQLISETFLKMPRLCSFKIKLLSLLLHIVSAGPHRERLLMFLASRSSRQLEDILSPYTIG